MLTFDQLEEVLLNPKIMVAMCDQHLLPKDLKLNSDYADNHMQVFIILRYLRAHLTSFNQETTTQLRSTWSCEREVDAW